MFCVRHGQTEKAVTTPVPQRLKVRVHAGDHAQPSADPDLERFVAKRMGATTFETDSSHVPMLSQPDFVLEAATAVQQKKAA
jgi:hypothetical protein